jgi:hypothetical protein
MSESRSPSLGAPSPSQPSTCPRKNLPRHLTAFDREGVVTGRTFCLPEELQEEK